MLRRRSYSGIYRMADAPVPDAGAQRPTDVLTDRDEFRPEPYLDGVAAGTVAAGGDQGERRPSASVLRRPLYVVELVCSGWLYSSVASVDLVVSRTDRQH